MTTKRKRRMPTFVALLLGAALGIGGLLIAQAVTGDDVDPAGCAAAVTRFAGTVEGVNSADTVILCEDLVRRHPDSGDIDCKGDGSDATKAYVRAIYVAAQAATLVRNQAGDEDYYATCGY